MPSRTRACSRVSGCVKPGWDTDWGVTFHASIGSWRGLAISDAGGTSNKLPTASCILPMPGREHADGVVQLTNSTLDDTHL